MSNSISGNVTGTTGAALNGAAVALTNVVYSSPTQAQITFTDSSGNYTFSGLGAGKYRITVTSSGVMFRRSQIVTIVPTSSTDGGTIGGRGWPLINNTVTPQNVSNINFAASTLNAVNS